MAAATEYYVDPAAGNDTTGDGSSGTPWKTVQKALDTITRDATDGDRINVKAGSADVLSAKLNTTTYGAPSAAVPLIFQGYTSSAGDGGIGDIDGNASISVFSESATNGVHVIDMHMHNCGANQVLRAGADCVIARSEFDTTTKVGAAAQCSTRSVIVGCYIHDFTGSGCIVANGIICYNFIEKSHTTDQNAAIKTSLQGTIHHNLIKLSGAANKADGINLADSGNYIYNNSIWSNAGEGDGVVVGGVNQSAVFNNVVDGFSKTGGSGLRTAANSAVAVWANAVNDCATAYVLLHDESIPYGDNETLAATPFTDVSATAGANDYTPADVGNVLAGFVSQFVGPSGAPATGATKGAVQPVIAAASTGTGSAFKGLSGCERIIN